MLKTTATPNKIKISLERSRLGKTTSMLAAFSLKISMLGKKKEKCTNNNGRNYAINHG